MDSAFDVTKRILSSTFFKNDRRADSSSVLLLDDIL